MKINRLESENIKMREEFNVQRAKMKELFLQKEGNMYNLNTNRQIVLQ